MNTSSPVIAKPETRVLALDLKIEERGEKRAPVITGYAAVFNSLSEDLGWFREKIAPGAFKRSIDQKADVVALINHDSNLVLGRTGAGTCRLSEDERGLKIEIDPPDTQAARDLMVSMKRGDVSQMSFAFGCRAQEWDDTTEPPTRTLKEVDLYDVSVVTRPAYPDTSAAVRSLEEHRSGRTAAQRPQGPTHEQIARQKKAELLAK